MKDVDKRKKLPPGTTGENFTDNFRSLLDAMDRDPEKFSFINEEQVGNPITLGQRVTSPEDWAAKQTTRAAAAADDWLKGVKKPRRNPVESAIKANAKRKDKLAQAEKEEKWLKSMQNVDLDEMYETIDKVGASGFRSGVEARSHKVERVVKDLQPRVAALAALIDTMPDATDADREKRLLAARKGMIEIGKKRRGG